MNNPYQPPTAALKDPPEAIPGAVAVLRTLGIIGSAGFSLLGLGLVITIIGIPFGTPLLVLGITSLAVLIFRFKHPALFWSALLGNGLAIVAPTYFNLSYNLVVLVVAGACLLNVIALISLQRVRGLV